ncbi:MAG: DNA cytosine methyltransferase [Ruminococcus sp.]|nr:DNA cytosine methyltransferase [Ruminococcus sp.]
MSKRTYVSLFSGAGVGCYGFKENGFECVATNERLESRMNIQRYNEKCKYPSGYICGDICNPVIKAKIFDEIGFWKKHESIDGIDVLMATPPCQGMSTVNYKKNDEQTRNSLVVEAIRMVKQVCPKVFIFENVRAFMKTVCTDIDGRDKPIKEAIFDNLSNEYNIEYRVLNFCDYGVPSSRPRTLVIGVSKSFENISPSVLFPARRAQITLRQAIGDLRSLEFCETDENDVLHFARPFPEYMLEWIKDLKEGESAFKNPPETRPYKLTENGREELKSSHINNKFRRLFWDKPGACVHTRNDILGSQDTIHPSDNRVLSIRELMRIMSIPDSFKWTALLPNSVNRTEFLAANELNIRRCIGEAVPTAVISAIAENLKGILLSVAAAPLKENALYEVKK